MNTDTDLLWYPSRSTAESSNIAGFMRWLSEARGLSFSDYTELWRWSTTDLIAFWSAVWEFYGLDAVSGYDDVLPDPMPLEKSSSQVAAVTVCRLGACPDDRVPVVQGDAEVALPAVVAAPRGCGERR
ncbi:hypothetical protein ACFY2M_39470 [Streptomyces sp. NPDC001276]|uniref:hypothetical protein n=1 Tax=Streptomyces sp. NPDC001276 TaxID=3364555 RepID=UPI00368E02C6